MADPQPTNPNPSLEPTAPLPPAPRWWKWVGLKRRQGRIPFKPSLWGWTLIIVLGGAAGMLSFLEYSMQPDFCRSCHLMEPYYQAWHTSTHKTVSCPDCHFEPGLRNTLWGKFQASSQAVKFITGTYGSKPHAEVRDASCMREGCHETRLLEGKVAWDVQTPHGRTVTIRFDHTPHLKELRRGKQLRCVSCHSQIVQGQHIVVTTDTCYLCHFKDLEHGRDDQTIAGCKACHDAPKERIQTAVGLFNHAEFVDRGVGCQNCHSDSLAGDGNVPRQHCWNCHNKPADIAKYDQPELVHKLHVYEHKVECRSCHVQIEHNLIAGAPAGDDVVKAASHMLQDQGKCGQCHGGSHSASLDVYRGHGARGVPDLPSPMFRAQVDCIACHRFAENAGNVASMAGQTYITQQASCDYCHGNHYTDTLDQWRSQMAEQLANAQAALVSARTVCDNATLSAARKLDVQRALDDADFNINFVQLGRGVHNVNYATAALSAAQESCAKAVALATPAPTTQPVSEATR